VTHRAGRQRPDEVGPQTRGRRSGAPRNKHGEKAGDCFYGRGTGSGLPFGPLLSQPAARPLVRCEIIRERQPGLRFAGLQVEVLATWRAWTRSER
jgi:hypothetical protein